MKNWLETRSGVIVDLTDPRPGDIHRADIAHALANTCRYGGHTSEFYSVAEHCVLMADWAFDFHGPDHVYNNKQEFARECLLHDAAEAYVGDLVSGVKRLVPGFQELEDRFDRVIRQAFGLGPCRWSAEVKEADTRILVDEAVRLMTTKGARWKILEDVRSLGVEIKCWKPDQARDEFLWRFERYVEGAT